MQPMICFVLNLLLRISAALGRNFRGEQQAMSNGKTEASMQ